MIRALTADELTRLAGSLMQPSVLGEAAALLGCLLAAWVLVRLLRGQAPRPDSIWFGAHIADGVLFPVLALMLALVARSALRGVLPLALMHVAVALLIALVAIRVTVRVLQRAFPDSAPMRAVERWVSWLVWIAGVLWILGVLPMLLAELDEIQWKVGGTRISVHNLLEGTLTAIVVLVVALWVSSALEARLLAAAGADLSLRKMAAKTLRALLLMLGLVFALSAAGIDLTALSVLGGALGVGIGLGLQKLAANYVSGFVILLERSVRIGDLVQVDDFEGRVTDIGTRYTLIRALNGREAIVPNDTLVTQRVVNNTLADPKVALTTVVQVAYGTDLDTLLPQVVQAVTTVPRVLADPAPSASLSAFAADGLELTIGFWIGDPDQGTGNVRSDVNRALLRLLDGAGVEIPFPQRVLRRAS